jgi:hypothetical protein
MGTGKRRLGLAVSIGSLVASVAVGVLAGGTAQAAQGGAGSNGADGVHGYGVGGANGADKSSNGLVGGGADGFNPQDLLNPS